MTFYYRKQNRFNYNFDLVFIVFSSFQVATNDWDWIYVVYLFFPELDSSILFRIDGSPLNGNSTKFPTPGYMRAIYPQGKQFYLYCIEIADNENSSTWLDRNPSYSGGVEYLQQAGFYRVVDMEASNNVWFYNGGMGYFGQTKTQTRLYVKQCIQYLNAAVGVSSFVYEDDFNQEMFIKKLTGYIVPTMQTGLRLNNLGIMNNGYNALLESLSKEGNYQQYLLPYRDLIVQVETKLKISDKDRYFTPRTIISMNPPSIPQQTVGNLSTALGGVFGSFPTYSPNVQYPEGEAVYAESSPHQYTDEQLNQFKVTRLKQFMFYPDEFPRVDYAHMVFHGSISFYLPDGLVIHELYTRKYPGYKICYPFSEKVNTPLSLVILREMNTVAYGNIDAVIDTLDYEDQKVHANAGKLWYDRTVLEFYKETRSYEESMARNLSQLVYYYSNKLYSACKLKTATVYFCRTKDDFNWLGKSYGKLLYLRNATDEYRDYIRSMVVKAGSRLV